MKSNDKDPEYKHAISWLESLKKYMPKQAAMNQWDALLSESNTYQAAYRIGGVKLLVMLVFCELFTAHCIEVRDHAVEGEARHLYKIREEIDTSLLNELEQIVAGNLTSFRSLQSLIEEVSAQLKSHADLAQVSSRFVGSGQAQDVRSLASQYRAIIVEATSINPVVSSSGCN